LYTYYCEEVGDMPWRADHVTEEDLEQYCLGGLAEDRCARLEEHLLLCEPCRDRLTETENFVASMRQASRQWSKEHVAEGTAGVAASRTWRQSWPGQLAPMVIAALLVVCAVVWFGRHSSVPAPPPLAVELTAVRGAAPGQAPAGRPLLLELDLTGLSNGQPFAGEVVDASGARVAQFPVGAPARLEALPPGGYFVRIYKSSGELLREYALTVKR
jgi:anti-sigma factor RsiW